MAKPVSVIPTQPGAREELIAKLNEAPAQHAAALLDVYELVEMLHKRGMLDLLRGAASARAMRLSAGWPRRWINRRPLRRCATSSS